MLNKNNQFKCTWEEAIEILRDDPNQQELIYNSYLSKDFVGNAKRFEYSEEFKEVVKRIKVYNKDAVKILDLPSGNGIASYAFAINGFDVTSVDPDSSQSVGGGAMATLFSNFDLTPKIVKAWGEKLPFESEAFDVVYVRQGLHHASNLKMMLKEISRVIKKNGILIASREHVVDNYKKSLNDFLNSQADHVLYGGENAFLLNDYLDAIRTTDLNVTEVLGPFDSIINLYPNTLEKCHNSILQSKIGKLLKLFLGKKYTKAIGMYVLKRRKTPGRLYSFIAQKVI